eukprot:2024965-Amphidinium_carterae.1
MQLLSSACTDAMLETRRSTLNSPSAVMHSGHTCAMTHGAKEGLQGPSLNLKVLKGPLSRKSEHASVLYALGVCVCVCVHDQCSIREKQL